MKNTLLDKSFIEADGHVLIKDVDSGEVLLDKHNAINFENISDAMAGALANKTDPVSGELYHIDSLVYGDDGTEILDTGAIVYKQARVNHTDDQLHNQVYEKSVNASLDTTDNGFDQDNNVIKSHPAGEHYTDLIITSTLDYNEPQGQRETDGDNGDQPVFVFDELGIKLKTGKLISHIIFHPIEKSANRRIQVVYTLRIRAGK